ncbi:hypothetical protein [Micromonospora tarensis]|uniref:PIN domain-containing protein n=1 Tax=Micromonospora tarensis TaxID=2806100 RepID=A0ABS1YBQ5_9ACTN|nr:hypothetical protein [Micromonospora tarensis]MBM0274802.1 hypothetical protein [Micromonospora tarensis]
MAELVDGASTIILITRDMRIRAWSRLAGALFFVIERDEHGGTLLRNTDGMGVSGEAH